MADTSVLNNYQDAKNQDIRHQNKQKHRFIRELMTLVQT